AKEGKTKYDLGREGFLERAWQWKEQYGGRIVNQLKRIGSSCDWERERFTMDEGCSKAVTKVFISLYNKGLIYQGSRIINWCPACKTALSDAEVEYEEQDSFLWHIRYRLENSQDYLVVATTRPETMLGDTGVAVNPDDDRYKDIVGKNVILPIVNKPIPVVADQYVEMDFGTGVVKMTPAHDPNDFEVAMRHNLPVIRVMNDDGTMNAEAGAEFEGLDRFECRRKIVDMLRQQGLMEKIEPYKHNVGQCYRCKTVVEPIISKQWFVSMKELAEPAIKAVEEGKTEFLPDRFARTYFNWMNNIRDWCISRQLWWGHRIPAYYCTECGHTHVADAMPEKCEQCGCTSLVQDSDVLDTWFSSALWPFSTLGWPEQTKELEYFYPTNVLVTGYDIIFFWVARMIFSGLNVMGQTPFKHVLIHGIVRDSQGRKMSKSLGNGIDPLEVIDKYGADALRFSLAMGNAPGNDMRFYWEKVEAYRNFANKIWNAARFVMLNLDSAEILPLEECEPDSADKWILMRYNAAVTEVTDNMEKFELGLAAQKLYDFIWSEYCDWYIELTKPRLYGTDTKKKSTALSVLCYVLSGTMKLLHPFMPFITEEIYTHLPGSEETVMRAPWPETVVLSDGEGGDFEAIIDMIKAVRNLRAEMNVPVSKRTELFIRPTQTPGSVYSSCRMYLEKLASASSITLICDKPARSDEMASVVTAGGEGYIPLGELIDIAKECERLRKEEANLTQEVRRAEGKLNNQGFVAKAPQNVIDAEREKLKKYTEMLANVRDRIKALEAIR
ncbi:MAG: valine--tRNA ligase, partial [Firmicutes bacterium]|nr:valine--tRNA ligase [Bacillota bacterium]